MIKLSNKSFALAFVVSLAAPLAFAQDATTEATTEASTEATTEAAQTEQVTPVTEGNVVTEGSVDAGMTEALSWNDVDTNQDGALSQTEAVAVPSLVEVFVEADADADGALTAEEYQSFVAQAETGAGDAP